MKLIFCTECQDVVRLTRRIRACECKKCRGKYEDDKHAWYHGPAIPLGMDNASLVSSVREYKRTQNQKAQKAFYIEVFTIKNGCRTMIRKEDVDVQVIVKVKDANGKDEKEETQNESRPGGKRLLTETMPVPPDLED